MRRTASMALIVCLLVLSGWAQASDDRQKKTEERPRRQIVGLKFDCKLNERDGYISIDGKLELNDLVSPTTASPTIRAFQAEIETAILPDKATTIGVYDDADSKRRYELRATVTKAK